MCSILLAEVSTVPPALLSNTQTLTWKLVGSLYTPLNGATAVYASEVDPSTDLIWARPSLARLPRESTDSNGSAEK